MIKYERPLPPDLVTTPRKSRALPSFYHCFILCGVTSIFLGLARPDFDAALLALLTLSGALAGSDFIDSVRRKRDIFTIRALVSALMFHTTYVTPLMHLGFEAYPIFLTLPADMERAFFGHAILQAFCVGTYFIGVRIFAARKDKAVSLRRSEKTSSHLLLRKILIIFGVVSFLILIYTVLAAGGPSSWINAQLNYREGIGTSGWVISLAEAFPSLFFMAYMVRLTNGELTKKQIVQRLILAVIVLVAVTFITSGLRGSRANLVWPSLSALLMIHILFYKIKLRVLAVFAVLIVVFASLYNIYKKEGLEGVQEVQEYGIDELSSSSAYSFGFESVLMSDFSRSSIQTVLLDRWENPGFRPYYGLTYLGDIMLFVPGAPSSEAIPNKSLAATDILYGPGTAKYTDARSSRIYGLQGEGLMNFGPVGAVLVFIPFAYIVSRAEVLFRRADTTGAVGPAMLYSVIAPAVMLLYLSDLDNVLRNITSNALLPAVALFFALVYNRQAPKLQSDRTSD